MSEEDAVVAAVSNRRRHLPALRLGDDLLVRPRSGADNDHVGRWHRHWRTDNAACAGVNMPNAIHALRTSSFEKTSREGLRNVAITYVVKRMVLVRIV